MHEFTISFCNGRVTKKAQVVEEPPGSFSLHLPDRLDYRKPLSPAKAFCMVQCASLDVDSDKVLATGTRPDGTQFTFSWPGFPDSFGSNRKGQLREFKTFYITAGTQKEYGIIREMPDGTFHLVMKDSGVNQIVDKALARKLLKASALEMDPRTGNFIVTDDAGQRKTVKPSKKRKVKETIPC